MSLVAAIPYTFLHLDYFLTHLHHCNENIVGRKLSTRTSLVENYPREHRWSKISHENAYKTIDSSRSARSTASRMSVQELERRDSHSCITVTRVITRHRKRREAHRKRKREIYIHIEKYEEERGKGAQREGK